MSRVKFLIVLAVILSVGGFAIRHNAESLATETHQRPDLGEGMIDSYAPKARVVLLREVGLASISLGLLLFPIAAHHWCSNRINHEPRPD